MNIPNDEGGLWRARKFAEYQHEVPPVDRPVLVEYAKRHGFTYEDCVRVAFRYGVSGCAISTLLLETMLSKTPSGGEIITFFQNHLDDFIFDGKKWERYPSANKYLAPGTPRVVETLLTFHGVVSRPYVWLRTYFGSNTASNYYRVMDLARGFPNYGRLSADAFAELLIGFSEAKLLPKQITFPNGAIDWIGGRNVTSGTFNLLYRDDRADAYDQSHRVTVGETIDLNQALATVEDVIADRYDRRTAIPLFAPKLCSWRNLFKQRRYGGYHHDWQLENLRKIQASIPANPVWDEIFDIRRSIFPAHFLGEVGGWTGIRPGRKKLWAKYGFTGVEPESQHLLN